MLLLKGSHENADRLWNVETGEDDLLRLLRLDPICHGTGTLWRWEFFVRMGMWDETLRIWQDIDLHLRAFTEGYRFVKRFDLPSDVYLRETDSSLGRGEYHSREKLENIAREIREWRRVERVLTRVEWLRLRFAELCRISQLDRMPHVRRMRDSLTEAFHTHSTLGRLRVDPGAGPNNLVTVSN